MHINKEKSETIDLMKTFLKIEELKKGTEDVLAFVYEDVVYMCNAHANSYTVGGKQGTPEDFWKVQEEIRCELERRGISIELYKKDKEKQEGEGEHGGVLS